MPPAQDYNQTFEDAGQAWNVDPSLLRAIIKGESGSQGSAATSYKGAEGIAQFMPATARGIGMTDTRDPEQSIWGAAKLMSQNLDAAKGDVPTALKIYQGGPDRSKWGPQNAAYPAYIMSKYKAAAPANDAAAPAPAAAPAQPSGFDAAYGKGGSTAPAPATIAPQPSGFDAAYGPGSAPAATEAPAPAKTGILANMAAGLGDGAKMGANILSDPFGNLVGKPLATAAVFGHDALAPVFGYNRFSPETRDMLLGDNVPQPGTRMVDAAAGAAGVNLAGIEPQTPLEAIARGATGGLVGGGILGGANRLTALMGATGGTTGAIAEQAAPDWAKPAAGLAGNIVGGGAVAGANGLMRAIQYERNRPLATAEPAAAAARVEPRLNSAGPAPAEPVTPGNAAPGQGPSAGMGGPSPGMGAPAPNSMGAAATPAEMAVMSDRELAAYKKSSDLDRLNHPVKRGDDPTQYVENSFPSAAARMGDADLAVQHKLAEQTPGNKQPFQTLKDDQAEAQVEHYQKLAGDATITNSLSDAKNAAFETQVKGVLANAKPVDISPLATEIDKMLAGPDGKETAVARELSNIKSKLYDSNDKLETDPNMLYGIRKEINARLSKEATSDDPTVKHAKQQLMTIKGLLDDHIEEGAPGFKQGIANFAEAMRPIESQQILQQEMPNLFNANGNGAISPAKYSAFMKRVYNQQNETAGPNPYKSMTDETTGKLYDLHSDLQRNARIDELAKTGTAQTSMLMRGTSAAAETGAHLLAAAYAPVIGNFGVKMAKEGLANYRLKGKTNRLLDGMSYAPLPPP